MDEPKTPANETERLRSLYGYQVLDTPAEAQFDAIVRLAAQIVGAPISLISLVDADRQWFKARYGLDVPETSRSVSFCGHAVASGAPLEVNDAREDPRFSDSPLVVGEPRIVFYAGMPIITPDGFPLGTLCTIDLVPRRLTEAQRDTLRVLADQVVQLLELRKTARLLAEERRETEVYARFFSVTRDLKCTTDTRLAVHKLNPMWERSLGWNADELRARPLDSFLHEDDRPGLRAAVERLLRKTTATEQFENRFQTRAGGFRTLQWQAVADGDTIFATARDVTVERENAIASARRDVALAASEQQLRVLFEGMDEGVVHQDATGAFIKNNAAAERMLGLSADELCGRSSIDPRWRCVHVDGSPFPNETHPAIQVLKTGVPQHNVIMGVHKPDGALSWISINSAPLFDQDATRPHSAITTFRDVTDERRAAELAERMTRQERLVTTGTLAAGVGHEINNPLSYVMVNTDLALEEVRTIAGGSPAGRLKGLVELLGDIRDGAERIRRIVRGLKALGREDGPPIPTDIASVLDISINMAMHEMRQRATLLVELDNLPEVTGDESRLTQVFVNLLVNAAQSFEAADPSTNKVVVHATRVGDTVRVSITDNGPGIPDTVLPRIFDPFFTTKPVNVGTGLGLSISHTIVTGTLDCETRPGVGTTFHVTLPVSRPMPGAAEPAVQAPRGRVLLIDDDDAVLRTLKRLLEPGHAVQSFNDPRAALATIQAGERFDVVFCDLMMPHLDGMELFSKVEAIDGDLARRFVFVTGGISDDTVRRFLAEVPNERLEKPFSTQNVRGLARRFADSRRS